jgi:hypothetical protein
MGSDCQVPWKVAFVRQDCLVRSKCCSNKMKVLTKIFFPSVFRETGAGSIKVKCKLFAFNFLDASTRRH